MNYGIQLYSVRDLAKDNYELALKKVAEMGYKMVEPAGFFGHDSETVSGWLKKYGLTACGTHTGLQALVTDFDATVAYHKAIGTDRIIIPAADFSTKEKVDEFIDAVNKYIPLLEKEGMKLYFHNHAIEFLPNKDGVIPHEELQKRTDILFEIDTYWVFAAGLDVVSVLEKLKDRTPIIHLKDGLKDRDFTGKSLGQGEAPVVEALNKAAELGMDIVVESEGLDPTGIEEVARCMEFLKSLDK